MEESSKERSLDYARDDMMKILLDDNRMSFRPSETSGGILNRENILCLYNGQF